MVGPGTAVNDDLFRALAWAAVGYAAVVDRWDRLAARMHRVKTGLWWHDEIPEPDDLPDFGTGGVYHAEDDHRFNRNLMPEFYLPDPP